VPIVAAWRLEIACFGLNSGVQPLKRISLKAPRSALRLATGACESRIKPIRFELIGASQTRAGMNRRATVHRMPSGARIKKAFIY
jgi:hypothetical protein